MLIIRGGSGGGFFFRSLGSDFVDEFEGGSNEFNLQANGKTRPRRHVKSPRYLSPSKFYAISDALS